MPDLNTLMNNIQKKSSDLHKQLQNLLIDYEELYRESNNRFTRERLESGGIDGLEDFYRLVNIIRRNRDVVGSLSRGLRNIRSMDKFKFVEQDIPEEPIKSKKKKGRRLNKNKINKLKIPDESVTADAREGEMNA